MTTDGGPLVKRTIGRWVAGIETGVVALVLLSCGGSDPASPPSRLSEPDAGDEQGITIYVRIRATDERVTVRPRVVPAFLPLRISERNDGERVARFRAPGVPDTELPSGLGATNRVKGLEPGRYIIRAGRGRTAVLRVKAGG